jgi:hypothetical protein
MASRLWAEGKSSEMVNPQVVHSQSGDIAAVEARACTLPGWESLTAAVGLYRTPAMLGTRSVNTVGETGHTVGQRGWPIGSTPPTSRPMMPPTPTGLVYSFKRGVFTTKVMVFLFLLSIMPNVQKKFATGEIYNTILGTRGKFTAERR